MRAFKIIGVAGLLVAAGTPAAAQEAGARLNLICTGSDAVLTVMEPSYRYGRPYGYGMMIGEGRQAAQLGVMVENGAVRVKPPKSSEPLFAKDDRDGWYDLTDVSIDRLTIRGRLKWNRLDRSKLVIDRRNGQATFGGFSGMCAPVTEAPEPTKF